MFWYEEEVQALEKKIKARSIDDRPVVFYGSSSIRLWTSLAQDFPQYNTLNLGFGGSTLAACAWFFDRLVVPANPKSIIFYAGDNDLGDGRHVEEVYLFFSALTQKLQNQLPNVPLTFMAIKPSPARWAIVERIRYANELIRKEVARHPHYHYVDSYTPMLSAACGPRPELFQADGLHLNAKGYALWREVLLKHPQIF